MSEATDSHNTRPLQAEDQLTITMEPALTRRSRHKTSRSTAPTWVSDTAHAPPSSLAPSKCVVWEIIKIEIRMI